MKYSKIKAFLFAPLFIIWISVSSCSDFLSIDDYTKDMLTYDSIFSNKVNLESYLWAAAGYLPDEGNIWGTSSAINNTFPGVCAADETYNQWRTSAQPGTQFVQGLITADNIGTNRMNIWPNMYKIIRKANLIINNIDMCSFTHCMSFRYTIKGSCTNFYKMNSLAIISDISMHCYDLVFV